MQTVLVGVTGGIAAYKACELVRCLQKKGYRVKVMMTRHAESFVGATTFRALTHEAVAVNLFDNPFDPIHHISLAQEADLVVVAPATANCIAKMAAGIADDIVSSTLLATRAPILVAPAMNTGMWEAAATQDNIRRLQQRGVLFVMPDSGYLACGDTGTGKLAPVEQIAFTAAAMLSQSSQLVGEHILISAGGTQEAIDPVRYIGNRSSGKFGYALAEVARSMGADVTLVSGPSSCTVPAGVHFVSVQSAQEMFEAVDAHFDQATVFISAAAVADYTPVHTATQKLKKEYAPLESLELRQTVDILATMSARKAGRTVIGFAAETEHTLEFAREKLARKGCDAIVANDVSRTDSGFGSDTTAIAWLSHACVEELPIMTKREAAREILVRVAELRGKDSANR
ncbi:bifunctional phosphopantothenoylcysteine decarboxylase/phosphopantothenate--cysteine ligase CoaBC [Collinsella sp. zg1085]|uniref:bifunctional phosphopantothenoylcysteine decarboxylase/phosphopantothenate--cysteine ligase CoaBC n=1 Tax=Collinsella sp. zg1085 TaxID=2844380 RepID=UPI001C0D5380|nr:bifunctional phosphopantothenoylcysteine decarboxylase/phosphopantothenate--cysteine ligase CoaBC [Collinsella sp. zg1085]QWT17014.1 bifunctional phosphopantothenoylcysteine decarboxylase/phosphopantothenate--cysteine ligase CoaBC [Collinsella sp. zg1085]